MNDSPLVSIVMASYNHAEYIGAAIDSVLAQDYSNWELLIVDDASTDSTREVLIKYADPRIKPYYFSINRQDHPRNYALKIARGKYVAFLNSDDLFLPGKLSKQAKYLDSHSATGAVFSHTKCIDENGADHQSHPLQELFQQPNRTRHEWLRWFFHYGNALCFSSAMVRVSAISLDSTSWFNPSLIQVADWDLWIRICLENEIWIIPEHLTATRVLPARQNLSADSVSNRNRSQLEIPSVYQNFFSRSALTEANEIFPELHDLLPCDSTVWRHYLICYFASCHGSQELRRIGYQEMQQLLSDDSTVELLKEENPRLMRNFSLTAASSALQVQAVPTHWVYYVPNITGSYSEDYAHRFWREFDRQTVSFSLPKPSVSGKIRIDPSDEPITFQLRGLRIYSQLTGEIIWELGADTFNQVMVSRKVKFTQKNNYWIFHSRKPDPHLILPDLDFPNIAGKWLDFELDLTRETDP